MSISLETTLCVGGTLAFIYPVFARLAGELVQPQRRKIIEIGRSLLKDSRTPDRQRTLVRTMMKASVSPWAMWWWVALFPSFLLSVIKGHAGQAPATQASQYRHKDFSVFMEAALASMMASNIIGAILFVLLVLLASPLLLLFHGQRKRTAEETSNWRYTADCYAETVVERKMKAACA
ncbi:hypothetical protein [Komagataeibacter saccharivorans]|uniref:hypothetical protein n=1 Tax=Komagataeibacter saccharivorans TaxID=265959 RepID=UPI0024A7B1F1|nr:hypothetical protein [Komagataeibacter saccharivorans]